MGVKYFIQFLHFTFQGSLPKYMIMTLIRGGDKNKYIIIKEDQMLENNIEVFSNSYNLLSSLLLMLEKDFKFLMKRNN